jgi:hypothetical protein
MSLYKNRDLLKVATLMSGLAFFPAAFVAVPAASDFRNLGCGDLPQIDWKFSGQCQDAHAVMWGAGLLALAFVSLAIWLLMRLRHV